MITLFNEECYGEVVAGLRGIGYHDTLLEEDYKFPDYFTSRREERQVAAVAFGQTPVSYDTALIGVALSNGLREQALINSLRALGAPILLEVDNYEVRQWAVSHKENQHTLVARYPADRITNMIERHAREWKPEPLLRAKNIGSFNETAQSTLFAGLLPELEEHIQEQLEPLLYKALSTTKAVYKEVNGSDAEPSELFKLIFWVLTAKIFHDRSVSGFIKLSPDPDAILNAVAKQYDEIVPQLLDRESRSVAVDCIWNELDFRHLSVEVLAQMWSTMLIDSETKKRLGIHRTPRSLVRYIVERIPLQQPGDDPRIIFEPCTGSAAFLIGVMNALRPNLFLMAPDERHRYFTKHIAGIEKDPFGVEISHFTLALADFPNLSGWTKRVKLGDVFEPGVLTDYLKRAGVVLCNPPFEQFDLEGERKKYQVSSPWKPVELLNRVLDDLHPSGVLGFVLPRNFVDGTGGYKEIRKRLAKRFANIDITVLPDRAFEADVEVALLIATEPIPHDTCQVSYHKVNDTADAWKQFELGHKLSLENTEIRATEKAAETFAVYELPKVWNFLFNHLKLGDVAELRRGIEWNQPLIKKGGIETGNRSKFVREEYAEGFTRGVAPLTKFKVFEQPRLSYLSLRSQDLRHTFDYEWSKPKVILNKSTKSRGKWRIAAFPDTEGVTFYQTFIGAWSKSQDYDELVLAAILNSPVANAFVSTREGKTDITMETLRLIPIPQFSEPQREKLKSIVRHYQEAVAMPIATRSDASQLLMEIDALVLDGYRMPPRLENELLEHFRGEGQNRPTFHHFGDYLPPNSQIYFSLSERLSPKFENATVGKFRQSLGIN